MLIVSKTNGGSTDLHDEIDIFLVMLGEKSVAYAESVLVTGYTSKWVFLTVEYEAVVRIDLEASHTETRGNRVNSLAASDNRSHSRVKIRIASAVPEMYVLDGKISYAVSGREFCYSVALAVKHGVTDLVTVLLICYVYLYLYVARNRGGYLDAGAAVVVEIKVGVCNCYEIYVTVKTAVEGEVCHLRIYLLVRGVVHYDSYLALISEALGEVNSPGGVSAVVMSLVLTVNVYVCGRVRTADLEIVLIGCGELTLYELLGVKTRAAEVVVAAVLSVGSVPGVGEIYAYNAVVVRGGRAIFGKLPTLV